MIHFLCFACYSEISKSDRAARMLRKIEKSCVYGEIFVLLIGQLL